MVTTMDNPCPNGVQEEEAMPSGQPGMEGPPAVQSSQGAETSGGEDKAGWWKQKGAVDFACFIQKDQTMILVKYLQIDGSIACRVAPIELLFFSTVT